MSNRLNQEREEKLQPLRMTYANNAIQERGYKVTIVSKNELNFEYKGNKIIYFAYSGWHSGKGIQDGRGILKLLRQI